MDESQLDQIGVSLLTPYIGRILAYAGASLATVGVTLTINNNAAAGIATAIVGLLSCLAHWLIANATNRKIASAGIAAGKAAPLPQPNIASTAVPIHPSK